MASSYKALKEDFVSNLSGGNISEINLVTSVAPASYFFWSTLQSRHSFFHSQTLASVLTDFLLNTITILLATTIYAPTPRLLLSLLLAPAILVLALPASKIPPDRILKPQQIAKKKKDQDGGDSVLSEFPTHPFLTVYRGAMMVVTCSSILAVDFRVFPRRFAKVETWGTSLMDVGVGSFVFSAGLVAAKGQLKRRGMQGITAANNNGNELAGFLKSIGAAIRQALPLFILGLIRLISVKNLDYAEHVSEYGVHWNFFFTLAMLPLALCFLQPLLSLLPGPAHGYVGMILAVAYEMGLQGTGLKAWALTAPRDSLLGKNKEGVVSWVGYLAIFLFGIETGITVLPREVAPNSVLCRLFGLMGFDTGSRSARASRFRLLGSLATCSALYILLLLPFSTPRLFPGFSIPISRRLANAPYALWIAAFNNTQILLFAIVETVAHPSVYRATTPTAERQATEIATPRVLADFNGSGLLVFLVANLGTGLINLSIDTLDTGPIQAIGILSSYLAILSGVARLLKGTKIKI